MLRSPRNRNRAVLLFDNKPCVQNITCDNDNLNYECLLCFFMSDNNVKNNLCDTHNMTLLPRQVLHLCSHAQLKYLL